MRSVLLSASHRPAPANEPYAPVRADFGDSADEQILSGSIKRHNAFARIRIVTSGTSLRIGYWCNYPSYSALTILVNGVFNQTAMLNGDGAAHTVDVTLPAGSAKVVDIWESPQFWLEPNVQAGVITSLEVLDGTLYVIPPAAPERRVVVYGDSISQGHPVEPKDSWIGLIRRTTSFRGFGITSYGSGGRQIYQDSVTPGLSTVASILSACLTDVQPGGRQDLVVAIGTNDWGTGPDGGVSNFQTRIATLVDAVHAAQSAARVQLVSPIIRSGEATPNGNGNTLAQYRTAMSTVASTRSSWCTYWDASSVMTLGDLGDGVHPLAVGYVKMANFILGTVLA